MGAARCPSLVILALNMTLVPVWPQEMANLLWSYAMLGHYPCDELLEAMAMHMVDRIQAYRPQAVSNSLWAFAKVRLAHKRLFRFPRWHAAPKGIGASAASCPGWNTLCCCKPSNMLCSTHLTFCQSSLLSIRSGVTPEVKHCV